MRTTNDRHDKNIRRRLWWAMTAPPTITFGAMVLTGVLMLAIGCTSGASRSTGEPVNRELPRPSKVLVYDFVMSRDEVTDNQTLFQDLIEDANGHVTPTPSQRRLGEEAAQVLADELVRGMLNLGMSTERTRKGKRSPPNALVIDGAFLDVIEGIRLRHIIVGVSPSGQQLDVRVHVHQVSRDGNINLLEFMTHADSSEMAVHDTDVVANHRPAMEQMAVWCAKQALASLSELFAKKDWVP